MIYEKTLWHRLIHVTNPTYWDKAWLLLFYVIILLNSTCPVIWMIEIFDNGIINLSSFTFLLPLTFGDRAQIKFYVDISVGNFRLSEDFSAFFFSPPCNTPVCQFYANSSSNLEFSFSHEPA